MNKNKKATREQLITRVPTALDLQNFFKKPKSHDPLPDPPPPDPPVVAKVSVAKRKKMYTEEDVLMYLEGEMDGIEDLDDKEIEEELCEVIDQKDDEVNGNADLLGNIFNKLF